MRGRARARGHVSDSLMGRRSETNSQRGSQGQKHNLPSPLKPTPQQLGNTISNGKEGKGVCSGVPFQQPLPYCLKNKWDAKDVWKMGMERICKEKSREEEVQ